MKRVVLSILAVVLVAGFASAEATGEANPSTEPLFLAEGDGDCQLPDLAGMDEDETLAAMLEAGFEVAPSNMQAGACPATFKCNSITNCGKSANCSIQQIGQCCTVGGGLGFCCLGSQIKVETCNCRCTGSPCNLICPQNNNVRFFC